MYASLSLCLSLYNIYIYINISLSLSLSIYIYIYICMHMCVYVCMYVCMYVYIYICIHCIILYYIILYHIYIYIYTLFYVRCQHGEQQHQDIQHYHCDMAVSTSFATTASTETLNCTILGVIIVFVLPSPSQKLNPQSYCLAYINHYMIVLHGQRRTPTHMDMCI